VARRDSAEPEPVEVLPDSFPVPVRRAYVFRAELDGWPGVVRTIAVAEDQTLEQLHEAFASPSAGPTRTSTRSG
jgi:hypothetical protein